MSEPDQLEERAARDFEQGAERAVAALGGQIMPGAFHTSEPYHELKPERFFIIPARFGDDGCVAHITASARELRMNSGATQMAAMTAARVRNARATWDANCA